jgi:hypothetical protein
MKAKREEVVSKLKQLKEEAGPILEYIEQNPAKTKGEKISFDQLEVKIIDCLIHRLHLPYWNLFSNLPSFNLNVAIILELPNI